MEMSSFSPLPYVVLHAQVNVQLWGEHRFLATAGVLGTLGMYWLGHVYVHTHGHTHMAVTVSQSA